MLYSSAKGIPTSPHGLFLVSLMLSAKTEMDDTLSNKSWAVVANDGGMDWKIKEINQMERELLELLQWNVTVQKEQLEEYVRNVYAEEQVTISAHSHPSRSIKIRRFREHEGNHTWMEQSKGPVLSLPSDETAVESLSFPKTITPTSSVIFAGPSRIDRVQPHRRISYRTSTRKPRNLPNVSMRPSYHPNRPPISIGAYLHRQGVVT